jgi:sugar lactone lactonase YvrE
LYQFSVTAELEGAEDSFLFGGKYGVGIAKKDSSEHRYLHRFWNEDEVKDGKPERMRANDGAVDSKGRFWVGTLVDPKSGEHFQPIGKHA